MMHRTHVVILNPLKILDCLDGPLRGHARSHRYCASLEACGDLVGAGVPAKGPALATNRGDGLRSSPQKLTSRIHFQERRLQ